MANTIQMRRGTAANATTNNVVLAAGEWGYETDTGKVKIGDGTTAWNDLPYFESGGGGGGGEVASKTGTSIVFTEDAFYNQSAFLTTGNITLDLTGAVIGATSVVYCDRYTPTISGAPYLISGTISNAKLNLLWCTWDGENVQITVINKTYLSTPSITLEESIAEEITLSNFGVLNADTYSIKFNTVGKDYANEAAMLADQALPQVTGTLYKLTDTGVYYEKLAASTGSISDYLEISPTETGSAAAVTTPAYNGTDLTYTHTGRTVGVRYLYFVSCTGDGFLDSNNGIAEGTSAAGFTFMAQAADSTLILPLHSLGTYNFQIFIDDVAGNTVTVWNEANATIDLGDTSPHKIELRGTITGWSFNNSAQASKIYDVSNWGTLKLGNGAAGITNFFFGCVNMTISATDILDINSTSMQSAFNNCDSIVLIPNIHLWTGWNLVTNVNLAFANCAILNADLENIDFSAVTNFASMLQNADGWTGSLANIDTSSGTNFDSMFRLSALANPDVTNWNTSGMTSAQTMLSAIGTFDRSLANWDVTNVTGVGFNNLLLSETLSTANMDATVISWANQSVNSGVTCHFGGSTVTGTVADSGTTDGTTANRLVDSTQSFFTTVQIGDAVRNTTDGNYALVTNIVSDTVLQLNADIMVSGEAYIIYNNEAAKSLAKLASTYNWVITFGGFV